MSTIESLTRDLIRARVIDSCEPAIVDVWGPECQPCISLAPTFETLAETYSQRARFYKLEAPKHRMACVDLRVMSLPTFLFYSNGEEVDRLNGDIDEAGLRSWIEAQVSRTPEV